MGSRKHGLCKLCRQHAKFVRAHLIPNSFYGDMLRQGEGLLRVSNVGGGNNKRCQSGEFDDGIVCLTCERSFSECDRYAAKLLLSGELAQMADAVNAGQLVEASFNYLLLKRFVIATVWRIAASERPFGALVRLDESQMNRLRAYLQLETIDRPQDLGIVWSMLRTPRYLRNLNPNRIIANPHIWTPDGAIFVRLNLGAFVAILHLDEKPFPEFWMKGLMRPDRRLPIVVRDFIGSPELRVSRTIVNWDRQAPSPHPPSIR